MVEPKVLKTRVFELSQGRYKNLVDLAQAMGVSAAQLYRVREGKRNTSQKFTVSSESSSLL